MADFVFNIFTLNLADYHNLVLYVQLIIIIITLFWLYFIFCNKHSSCRYKFSGRLRLEVIWTVMPIMVLILTGHASLSGLYNRDALIKTDLNLKITGYQWYWGYGIPEIQLYFDSFCQKASNIYFFAERDLLVLPFDQKISCFMTSNDVIHAWTLPSLGVKIDALPGRLNFFSFINSFPRVIIGQCRELCGAYHSWMPIYVEFTSATLFKEWLKTFY